VKIRSAVWPTKAANIKKNI